MDTICTRTKNGFRRCNYVSSDDSKHFDRNRHILLVSQSVNDVFSELQPGFRHITSSVNNTKSKNAIKNSDAIIQTLGLQNAAHILGGCNDNAPDAQLELDKTFTGIQDELAAPNVSAELRALRYENGVKLRPVKNGDPYHIANLSVEHASRGAFGDTEHADHTQVHHCQLLQSIHSLNKDDKPLSQGLMNQVMGGSFGLKVRSKAERKQRWLVNQRNARQTLEMFYKQTPEGNSALIEWALKFANESPSTWKRRVGKEIATWLSMPSVVLGLHFEAELGNYFEEIYAWHCRPGPLYKRSGFRMMEIYDIWLGFDVPWWNEAVNNPERQLPKTMKYLEENFEGEEYEFRKSQIMRGLTKGRDEMMKMSTKYLLRPPLMYLLLTHREYGNGFLRAVLAVLAENPVDGVVLIHDTDSSEWGEYLYDNPSDRPKEVQKWYTILRQYPEELVHFWRQFRLNAGCLVNEFKKLSKQYHVRPLNGDTAPLLTFKEEYPILFESLEAVFGMMMSNSRLCEQMHGALRHGLRDEQGMDEVDARRDYEVVYGYMFKQGRREKDLSSREAKRQKVSNTHNNTKDQLTMISEQLTEYLPRWSKEANELLRKPNHGIPSLTDIKKRGRRVQDKKNIATQLEAHDEKAATMTREKLTIDAIKEEAAKTTPSNDNLLRMGEERLQSREHICTITTKKYWNDLEIDGRRPNYRILWISAVKTFPHLLPFHRGSIKSVENNHITIITNKTTATSIIGSYLKMAKKVTKLICDFCHGTDSNHKNFVPKRDRNFIQSDLLEVLDFVKVVDVSGSPNAVEESAANTCLSTFQIIDDHYTYTRPDDDVVLISSSDDVPADDGNAADAEVNEVQPNVDSNGPRRSSMRRRRPNSRRIYPGEESSSEEEESEDEDSDDAPVPFV